VTYPEGTPDFTRYTLNEYHTVGNRIRPPYTTIVKYDLNRPAIAWRVGYGNDPALEARGITGTGMPGIVNSLIVTASGLVFGAGLDNHIRAWDSANGRELWAARFGGDFLGSPIMYETGGRQFLVVPAAATAGARGSGAARVSPAGPPSPMGWVAYTLPGRLRVALNP
jgi:glucose dehydrogenase